MDPFLSFKLKACAEGHFGKNCSFSCKCKNGASCDPVNGNCRCPPGVSGDLCQDGETLLFVSSFNADFPAKIKSNYFKGTLDILHLQRSIFLVKVVLKASMGSSATRSVIVPIMDGATAPTERACVMPDSTDASVISVSPTAYTSTASHAKLQITKGQACCYFHCDFKYPWFLHLHLQRVPSGLLDPAVLKSVSVTSRTLSSVTAATAPVSVKLVTVVTPARKVSTVTKHKLCLCLYLYSCCLLQLYKYKTQKLQLPLEGQEIYRNFDVLFC